MYMKRDVHYKLKGKERGKLAQVIGKLLKCEVCYKGVPTFEYAIGGSRLDLEGTFFPCKDFKEREFERLIEQLKERGFVGEIQNEDELAISMPRSFFTEAALNNLVKLVDGKQTLLAHAFQMEQVTVVMKDEEVVFPWFQTQESEDKLVYTDFITKLCELAKKQKRIQVLDKEIDNEKYAFRCFLLRLGFIGEEYKNARKVLLKNLEGNSAFRRK